MSVAELAIVPAQDLLSLGNEARMNFPGQPQKNWEWRVRAGALDERIARRLREISLAYDRVRQ